MTFKVLSEEEAVAAARCEMFVVCDQEGVIDSAHRRVLATLAENAVRLHYSGVRAFDTAPTVRIDALNRGLLSEARYQQDASGQLSAHLVDTTKKDKRP